MNERTKRELKRNIIYQRQNGCHSNGDKTMIEHIHMVMNNVNGDKVIWDVKRAAELIELTLIFLL